MTRDGSARRESRARRAADEIARSTRISESRRRLDQIAIRMASEDPDGPTIEHVNHQALEEVIALGRLLREQRSSIDPRGDEEMFAAMDAADRDSEALLDERETQERNQRKYVRE